MLRIPRASAAFFPLGLGITSLTALTALTALTGLTACGSSGDDATVDPGSDAIVLHDDGTGSDTFLADTGTSPDGVTSDSATSGDTTTTGTDVGGPDTASADTGSPGTDVGGPDVAPPGWKLVWSDEFNGAAGAAPDPKYWSHDVGGGGFGNNEREYYTDGATNSSQHGGNLVIEARKESAPGTCWYGACQYTSARIHTSGKFDQKFGRFVARIQIPRGQGMWPAFWMLGNDIGSVGWPTSGEIDIMENIGKEPATTHGTIHGPGYSGGAGIGSGSTLSSGAYADGFHEFAIEWEAAAIRFYVDDKLYATRTPSELPAGKKWVYDHPFFIILNLAVGGGWPGDPDGSTTFPQQMKIDWVRVFTKA